jgi:hypothetical protein
LLRLIDIVVLLRLVDVVVLGLEWGRLLLKLLLLEEALLSVRKRVGRRWRRGRRRGLERFEGVEIFQRVDLLLLQLEPEVGAGLEPEGPLPLWRGWGRKPAALGVSETRRILPPRLQALVVAVRPHRPEVLTPGVDFMNQFRP